MSGELVMTIFSFKSWNERMPSGEELNQTHLIFTLTQEMWTLNRKPFRFLPELTILTENLSGLR